MKKIKLKVCTINEFCDVNNEIILIVNSKGMIVGYQNYNNDLITYFDKPKYKIKLNTFANNIKKVLKRESVNINVNVDTFIKYEEGNLELTIKDVGPVSSNNDTIFYLPCKKDYLEKERDKYKGSIYGTF